MSYKEMVTITLEEGGDTYTFVDQKAREGLSRVLPEVSSANNGEFLRVSDGVWTSCVVSSAEEVTF